MSKDPLAKVYVSQGMYAAEVVKAKLEANGIPAILKYESVGQIIGLTVNGLGRVEVHVPTQYAEEALRLVDEDEGEEPVDHAETDGEAADGGQA